MKISNPSSKKSPPKRVRQGKYPHLARDGQSRIRIPKTWDDGTPAVETYPARRLNKAGEIRVFPPTCKIDKFTPLEELLIRSIGERIGWRFWDCVMDFSRGNDADSRRERKEILGALHRLTMARVIIRRRSDRYGYNKVYLNRDMFKSLPESAIYLPDPVIN